MVKETNFYQAMSQGIGDLEKKSKAREKLDVGKAIRELREKKGLSGAELCRRSGGVDPATLSAIEKGRIRNPSLDLLQEISRGLGCLVRDLFTLAEMGIDRNYYFGSQKGAFQIEFPKVGLKIVSATPPTAEFFCGKLILGPQRKVAGDLLQCPAPIFLEVVMGQIEFGIEGERMVLKEGENIFFNGGLHHFLRNTSSRESALWLVTAPSFFTRRV